MDRSRSCRPSSRHLDGGPSIPERRQSKIVAFSGILALVHRPPWPFTPVGQAPPSLTDETAQRAE
jgi:hypothetical protein